MTFIKYDNDISGLYKNKQNIYFNEGFYDECLWEILNTQGFIIDNTFCRYYTLKNSVDGNQIIVDQKILGRYFDKC